MPGLTAGGRGVKVRLTEGCNWPPKVTARRLGAVTVIRSRVSQLIIPGGIKAGHPHYDPA
jgi:hypothetical protein